MRRSRWLNRRWLNRGPILAIVLITAPRVAAAPSTNLVACLPTTDAATLALRKQTNQCAILARGESGAPTILSVATGSRPTRAYFLGLLSRNAGALGMSSPFSELTPTPTSPESPNPNGLSFRQHAPGDPSIPAYVDCVPTFDSSFEGSVIADDVDAVAASLLIVERAADAMARPRIAAGAARSIGLTASRDFGDDNPRVVKEKMYLVRRDCKRDARALLVYRLGIVDTYGKRVIDVNAETGAIAATFWSDGDVGSPFGPEVLP